MKPVVVSRPEVESQGEFISQELSNRYDGQGDVFRDLCHFGVSFAACCEELLCLVPHLVGTHPLTELLVGDPLNGDLYFCYVWVVEGLSVTSKGLLRGTILKAHQYTLHAAGGHAEVDIPNRSCLC